MVSAVAQAAQTAVLVVARFPRHSLVSHRPVRLVFVHHSPTYHRPGVVQSFVGIAAPMPRTVDRRLVVVVLVGVVVVRTFACPSVLMVETVVAAASSTPMALAAVDTEQAPLAALAAAAVDTSLAAAIAGTAAQTVVAVAVPPVGRHTFAIAASLV